MVIKNLKSVKDEVLDLKFLIIEYSIAIKKSKPIKKDMRLKIEDPILKSKSIFYSESSFRKFKYTDYL